VGWTEWLIILVVAALLFRPRQFGKSVGDVAGSFREGARHGEVGRGTHAREGESASDQTVPRPDDTAASNERARLLAVLELPPDASAEQIQKAWRELAKVWHPDRFGHDPALQARATSRLAAINAAYAQLQRDATA